VKLTPTPPIQAISESDLKLPQRGVVVKRGAVLECRETGVGAAVVAGEDVAAVVGLEVCNGGCDGC
jgi:hypothetical protein